MSFIHSIWNGILTFLGGFLLISARRMYNELDKKIDREEVESKFEFLERQMSEGHQRQDTRHRENIDRLDHITERIDTLISRNRK